MVGDAGDVTGVCFCFEMFGVELETEMVSYFLCS